MRETTPITVLVGRFEDLLARGLRSLIDEDPSLKLVAAGNCSGYLLIASTRTNSRRRPEGSDECLDTAQ